MSWYKRRNFMTLAGAALAGCTFTPAYAPGGPAEALQGAIRVDDPNDKNGFDLVERLEERLGRPEQHRYALGYRISTESIGVGVTPENATTRYHLRGRIAWVLRDLDGATLAEGEVASFTSWSATGPTVAGLAAEEDAAYRLMRILADQIVTRLVAISGQLP
ncbi:LPS assembly lipoprotein LptE [Gemmobacter denitrificans]|uniref:LPS assembly lipoprotein LptE n=1 Tax=Gemmobacter denitrificans TaxID=3123040 RepID=A0ABU8BSL2_9RHOB